MRTLEELKALSRAAGLRVTRQRLSVLAGMVAAKSPPSHPELSALIGPRSRGIRVRMVPITGTNCANAITCSGRFCSFVAVAI
jgi:hypothetical protein